MKWGELGFRVGLVAVLYGWGGSHPGQAAGLAGLRWKELGLSAGVARVLEPQHMEEVGVEARFEGWRLFCTSWRLEPTVGILSTSDGSVYAYAGFRVPLQVAPRWQLVGQLAAGSYRAGDSFLLGGPLEFRSGLEIRYQMTSQVALGVTYAHLSNAGLYRRNPGSESLSLGWSWRP